MSAGVQGLETQVFQKKVASTPLPERLGGENGVAGDPALVHLVPVPVFRSRREDRELHHSGPAKTLDPLRLAAREHPQPGKLVASELPSVKRSERCAPTPTNQGNFLFSYFKLLHFGLL